MWLSPKIARQRKPKPLLEFPWWKDWNVVLVDDTEAATTTRGTFAGQSWKLSRLTVMTSRKMSIQTRAVLKSDERRFFCEKKRYVEGTSQGTSFHDLAEYSPRNRHFCSCWSSSCTWKGWRNLKSRLKNLNHQLFKDKTNFGVYLYRTDHYCTKIKKLANQKPFLVTTDSGPYWVKVLLK